MRPKSSVLFFVAVTLSALADPLGAAERLPLRVERHTEGAPVTLGVPFPKGALRSPDHVRVLTAKGVEIPSQITEVATWMPADPSIKWIWVFFFAGPSDQYLLEYGEDVRAALPPHRFTVVNNQREKGLIEVTTGPLRFVVKQGEGGFLDTVRLDSEGDGFQDGDLIAGTPGARGSFLDILDDAGLDRSKAVVKQTFIEKGSGRLHTILRVEGEYHYGREDNNTAPFVTRIHAYAGKPYLRVLHSFVYTGVPDKHRQVKGEHAHVATQAESIITPDESDGGWAIPDDRIAAAGLGLSLKLDGSRRARGSVREGRWWEAGPSRATERAVFPNTTLRLVQNGPDPLRMPPLKSSDDQERIGGFTGEFLAGADVVEKAERLEGWLDISDSRRGVALGLRHFIEEYPKELGYDPSTSALEAFSWSPRAVPKSFARASSKIGQEGAIENWAQGLAKTSEMVLYFHGADSTQEDLRRTTGYVLDPPVAHADPSWYSDSGVYGHFAPRTAAFPQFQRALDYKTEWILFNQKWEPWYGMFDYGDVMVNFNGKDWSTWGHGEPAQDHILWLQFMRTGDPRVFEAAQALSRHTMDVDNTHWPEGPDFDGASNYPLDYWRSLKEPGGSKWRGIGRRHSPQHGDHALSAHAWVAGWLADYYLAADHRALDMAVQTAEMHLRRLWGEHEVTGRRLYLSVWNLAEVWDATKEERYATELRERVKKMLHLQEAQGGNLVVDRYGYAQIYVSNGLEKVLAMTGDTEVRAALVRHARFTRDALPLNHWMESYLSSVPSLILGYDLTGDRSYLEEVKLRIADLAMEALPRPIDDSWTQGDLGRALDGLDKVPPDPGRFRPSVGAPAASPRPTRSGWAFTNGLRVFGWTHAYTLPYAIRGLVALEAKPKK